MPIAQRFVRLMHKIQFSDEDKQNKRREKLSELLDLLDEIETDGDLLGAGIAAQDSMIWFWGDIEVMQQLGEKSQGIFKRVLGNTPDPFSKIVAHIKVSDIYNEFKRLFGNDREALDDEYKFHRMAAAELLSNEFEGHPKKEDFLVKGVISFTNFEDPVQVRFVEYEVSFGGETLGGGGKVFPIPGAFTLLVGMFEYELALEIAENAPKAFRFPGVNGWREVCRAANAKLDEEHLHFEKAAAYFASDILDEKKERVNPIWSAFNSTVLAPYYRARAVLSKPYTDSSEKIIALKKASNEIEPDASGFVYLPARKLALLVHGLGSFLESGEGTTLDQLARKYQKEIEFWGKAASEDDVLLEGLTLVRDGIEGIRNNPAQELTQGRIAQGIRKLETLPSKSQARFVSELQDEIGKVGEGSLRVSRLERIMSARSIPETIQIHIDDIDSFEKARELNTSAVAEFISNDGYLNMLEDDIQIAFEEILGEAFHQKDWGGEINDLYTSNLLLDGKRIQTAFLLKGRGLQKPVLEISDTGKNGDQLIRLFESEAELFIVQFVGNISQAIIKDVAGKARERNFGGKSTKYCIINGQDTARILRAYGKL